MDTCVVDVGIQLVGDTFITGIDTYPFLWSLLTIGQAVKFKSTIKNQPIADKYQRKSFQLFSWRNGFRFDVSLLGD